MPSAQALRIGKPDVSSIPLQQFAQQACHRVTESHSLTVIELGRGQFQVESGSGTDSISIDPPEIDPSSKRPNQIAVRGIQQLVQARATQLARIDGRRRWNIHLTSLQRTTRVLRMSQRLHDDSFSIEQNHVPVPEQLDDQLQTTTSMLESQDDYSVKADLFDFDQARIGQMLPQEHRELRWIRRHRPIAP